MIKGFFCIIKADPLSEHLGYNGLKVLAPALQDTFIKGSQVFFTYFLFKPAQHRIFKDHPDLLIWYCHGNVMDIFLHPLICFLQIAGKKEKIPNIFPGFFWLDILISNVLMNRLLYTFSLDQQLYLLLHTDICMLHQSTDNTVRTGI